MKQDIDRLMEEASIDALLISGDARHNAPMTYFTGNVHVGNAKLLKKRGEEPILFHYAMEREEAAKSGLRTHLIESELLLELHKEADGDQLLSGALFHRKILELYEVQGRVAVYGKVEFGPLWSILNKTQELVDGVEFVGESPGKSILARARRTKDDSEVSRIRKMGEVTVSVVGDVATYLTSHRAKDGILVDNQGEPITIGGVKKRINLWLAMRGVENPHGTIFALGRDAGVPHSEGTASDFIELGKPIVFDIFPQESGGGFFYDFTRTWCVGFAPDDVQQLYDDVHTVYNQVLPKMVAGYSLRQSQLDTCNLFQSQGHKTILDTPSTQSGYVHSLGHGLGLEVHEYPSFSQAENNVDVLQIGDIVTFEPGLYYPDRGMGVRLEDTLWVRPDGSAEMLAEFPKDLVLKLKS